MRLVFLAFTLFCLAASGVSQNIKIKDTVRFLALGDSYTIGQSVGESDRWPVQLSGSLARQEINVAEVKIIAQTGWRTDDLKTAIIRQQPLTGYNLVSLLIGVNNQYQGGTTQAYASEFEDLLKTAISLAGNIPEHVFVLSIPDYAYTPFGNGNQSISTRIDEFNAVNRIITEANNVKYINITPISRNGLIQPDLVASDGLHPSGKMYSLWVKEIMKGIEKELGINEDYKGKQGFSYYVSQRQLVIEPAATEAELFIYNAEGKILRSQFVNKNSEILVNLSGLPAGIYFLIFRNKGKVIFRTKIALV